MAMTFFVAPASSTPVDVVVGVDAEPLRRERGLHAPRQLGVVRTRRRRWPGRYCASSRGDVRARTAPRAASRSVGPLVPSRSTSAMICVGRSSVSFSMPLATETIGTPAGSVRLEPLPDAAHVLRRDGREDHAWRRAKQSASLAVRRTPGGTFTPGSRRRCSRSWMRRSIDSSNAPHIVTSCPPCVSRIEQTVAIAPSPRIVTRSGILEAIVNACGAVRHVPAGRGAWQPTPDRRLVCALSCAMTVPVPLCAGLAENQHSDVAASRSCLSPAERMHAR